MHHLTKVRPARSRGIGRPLPVRPSLAGVLLDLTPRELRDRILAGLLPLLHAAGVPFVAVPRGAAPGTTRAARKVRSSAALGSVDAIRRPPGAGDRRGAVIRSRGLGTDS